MAMPSDSYDLLPGDVYVPPDGQHAGHRVTVVADEMPSVRFWGTAGAFDRWVQCDCGAAWSFSRPEADEEAKDGDGWPE